LIIYNYLGASIDHIKHPDTANGIRKPDLSVNRQIITLKHSQTVCC